MGSKEIKFYQSIQWENWLETLSTNDYVVADNFVPAQVYQKVWHYFDSLLEQDEFSKAAIGRTDKKQINSSIRGDFIYWLDPQKDKKISEFFALIDELLNNLRKHLFLSLSDYEFHFALYPPKNKV